MKTNAKTIGYNNGCRTRGRQVGRNANDFLSTPCNRFEIPPKKRSNRTAGTRTVARQKRTAIDEEIIARYPQRWKHFAIYAFIALLMSGIMPIALAEFEIWIYRLYGLGAFALCMAADVALIVWLVKRYG